MRRRASWWGVRVRPNRNGRCRELLADTDAHVRLRAAQGLVAGRDKSGVPVLIALLDGPADTAWPAEDLLLCLAGARAPHAPVGEAPAARRRARDAWALWWKGQEKTLDLSRPEADVSWFNPSLHSRQTTRAFLACLNSGNLGPMNRMTEVPFNVLGQQVLQRQEEVINYFAQILFSCRQQNVTLNLQAIVTVEEYLRTAPAHEREFLGKVRKAEVRVAYVQSLQNGRAYPNPPRYIHSLFLQIKGGQAHVFAVGQGMSVQLER